MMLSPLHSRRRLMRYLLAAFLLFVAFMSGLSGITYRVITHMVTMATEIDDNRAARAAATALGAMEDNIASSVGDNAVWAAAYDGVAGPDAAKWILDNWGVVTNDHPVSDGVMVFDAKAAPIAAYSAAKPFDPYRSFGPLLKRGIEDALASPRNPVVGFLKHDDGYAVVGFQTVRPDTNAVQFERKNVLVFYKDLKKDFIDQASLHYGLRNLALADAPVPGHLSVPIKGLDDAKLAYLSWNSEAPGEVMFDQERGFVLLGLVTLIVFTGIVFLAAFLEARRLKASADASWYLATHDVLTNLLNRSGFFHALDNRTSSSAITLFLMDLDGFKAVNDTWGHPVGDKLICLVADAMRNCHPDIRSAARFGGDEFAVATDRPESVPDMIEALLACFRAPFIIEEHVIEVGVSIGFATDADGISVNELLRRADLALYHAKDAGKGRAVAFTAELDEAKTREAKLELELRAALRTGEVFPVFQPLFDAKTHEIAGVEALARWVHPTETVSPAVFVPLAEKCGLIDLLGAKLLEQSVAHACRWPGLSLSVNISPLQLCNPGFAAQVQDILKRAEFDPSQLTLEVTEGVLISNPEQARRSIRALKKIGVTFALDDFGSGYASIGVLRQFGFDRIKIDRSLVSAAEADLGGLEVMKATVQLARALDLPVTAEGIENAEQARLLREAGCDQLQGYLFARPMTAAKIDQRRNSPAQTDSDWTAVA